MNKKLLWTIIGLVFSVSLLYTSREGEKYLSSIRFTNINAHRVESKIDKELCITTQQAEQLLNLGNKKCSPELFNDCINQLGNNHNISLFLFENDTLCFWSSSIDVGTNKIDSLKYQLVKLQNTFYFARNFYSKNKRVLALYNLYTEYPYENKYLINHFNSVFDTYKNYKPSKELTTIAIPIRPKLSESFFFVPIKKAKANNIFIPLLQLFSSVLLVFFIFIFFNALRQKRRPWIIGILLLAVITLLRTLSLWLNFPESSWCKLFSPELYAYTSANPSLGDFIINALLVFVLSITIPKYFKDISLPSNKKSQLILSVISFLPIAIIIALSSFLLNSLIIHSTLNIETFKILNLNIYSVLGYFAIGLWFSSAVSLLFKWAKAFIPLLNRKTSAVIAIVISIICLVLLFLLGSQKPYLEIAITVVSILFIIQWAAREESISLKKILILVAIFSAYTVTTASIKSAEKEKNVRKILAINLTSERDPLAEVLLPELYQKLIIDGNIRNIVLNNEKSSLELNGYLRKKYFKDYLNRYDITVTICAPSTRIILNSSSQVNCEYFFNNMVDNYGLILPSSQFYFLSLQNGFINYIGQITYRENNIVRKLYIELVSRPNWELVGYPELLIEGNISKNKLRNYSWAKYHNNKLISHTGDYSYKTKLQSTDSSSSNLYFFNQNNYSHLVYKASNLDTVIISKPRDELLNITASFAYNLFFFMFILILALRFSGHSVVFNTFKTSFKNRITWAIVSIILLSLFMVGSATIIYNIKSFEQHNEKNLSEKLTSIMFELDREIPYMANNTIDSLYLSDRLIELSNIFYADINIYYPNGKLRATSRGEIFDNKLLSKRMPPNAWYAMAYQHLPKYIDNEQIGSASYLSAYIPIIGTNGNAVGYLNLPYFTRHDELRTELYSIVSAIINIYALLALLAIGITVLISAQVMRPLELIRERLAQLKIEGKNDPIEYTSNDEVGQLIGEYNRMVDELSRSATELARNQRESAWREMARQIAHEVKNPLTPIKLSLQYLQKAKKDGVPDWDQRFDRFAQSLSEQINALTVIANEFSSFAKLPNAKTEEIDIYKQINEVLNMFQGYAGIEFSISKNIDKTPIVLADRDQLTRVFNNLIKNAIQSIERGKHGRIGLILNIANDTVQIDVTDNGVGIPDDVLPKLFTPNFTTKSAGTGLGLAITREIIVGFGGSIKVKTQPNVGSTFTVELPLARLD